MGYMQIRRLSAHFQTYYIIIRVIKFRFNKWAMPAHRENNIFQIKILINT